jgi:hypothetical protein
VGKRPFGKVCEASRFAVFDPGQSGDASHTTLNASCRLRPSAALALIRLRLRSFPPKSNRYPPALVSLVVSPEETRSVLNGTDGICAGIVLGGRRETR